jgi:hypothetical protein
MYFYIICIILKIISGGNRRLTPVILATQEAEIRRIMVQSQPGQIVHETPSRKKPSQKRAGGVAQVVESHLPSMHEAFSSNSSIAKRRKKIKK